MKTQHLAKFHSNRLILGNVLGKFVKYTEKAQGNQALIYLSVKKAILDALPDTKDELSAAIHQYFDIRDELSLRDGVIFKSKPCIIPPTRRQKIKQKMDNSHIGLQSFFRRARETVYWPCMNAEIADYTQKCDVCMSFQSTPTKEPPICDESPSRPWEKVANDFLTLLEKNYPCPAQ